VAKKTAPQQSQDKVRVGIVGAKFAADFHTDAYRRNDKVEVVAIADINPDNFKETRYNSACFIIETGRKKTALLWDLDNKNGWILNPQAEAQKKTVAALTGADYLFIDCFSWTVEEVVGFNTGHLSFATVRQYARALQPKETLLVHMGGHEEGEGNPGWGWTDRQWEEGASKLWSAEGLPGTVRVPATGEEFSI
jgi:hypothetical protein